MSKLTRDYAIIYHLPSDVEGVRLALLEAASRKMAVRLFLSSEPTALISKVYVPNHITVLFADLTCARARVSSCACAHFPISLKWR